MELQEKKALQAFAVRIRMAALDAIHSIGSGHVGGVMSIADTMAVLYGREMRVNPEDPKWPDRDYLVMSKGHAGPAVYAALARRGYFSRDLLLTLNQGGTSLPSHCDMLRTPGIDMTTGSLGQGFSCAVGVALGSRLAGDGATVYTVIGDGESQEGQIWEAAMFAAAKHLDNLIAFTDYNKLQIGGTVAEINDIAPLAEKWAAFGWHVIEVEDGNDVEQVSAAVQHAKLGLGTGKPTMVILNTVKGCGVPWIVDLGAGNHNANITEEQAKAAVAALRGEA